MVGQHWVRWILVSWMALTAVACNQERNESIRLMNEGIRLFRNDRLVKGIDKLSQAATVDPTNDKALFYEGMLRYQKLGELPKGEALLRKAIELNGKVSDYHYHLGTVLAAQDKNPEAVAAFDQCLELTPKHGEAHFRRALALEAQSRFDDAQAAYQEAIKNSPMLAEAYYALGMLYFRFEKYAHALQVLKNGAGNAPAYAPNYKAMGQVYQRQKRFDDAIARFEKSLTLDPGDAATQFNLGMAYEANGDPEKALEHLKRYLVQKSTNEDTLRVQTVRDVIARLEARGAP